MNPISSNPPSSNDLSAKKCVPCEGGVAPLKRTEAATLGEQLHAGWQIADDAKSLKRTFKFKDFYRTMSFVNAVAHVANIEDHHPDVELGYGTCSVAFSTHSIGGLSQNDFICAAKIDRIDLA